MILAWRPVLSVPFVVAALLLLLGVVSLQTVKERLGLVLQKSPVPLRLELEQMAPRFGAYEMVASETLSKEIEHSLGTPYNLNWVFRDSRLAADQPGAGIRLHVAYYTGTVDTVPHVPELCYVASGVTAVESGQIEVPLAGLNPTLVKGGDGSLTAQAGDGQLVHLPSDTVPVHIFSFRPRAEAPAQSVFYFFMANGRWFGSKEGVRLSAINIRDRYAYYCKIEVMPGTLVSHPQTGRWVFAGGMANREDAIRALSRFLATGLPEVFRCLPDWTEVRAGRYPPPTD